jgi:L-threonylcarbamoyladenylate synthase
METTVLAVDPAHPEPAAIADAAAVLRRGGLVAFPTETVYGLGANALDAAACARIFAAKGRPPNNPIIVHAADMETARQVVTSWPESASQLANRFWPGPLTLVLPRNTAVPDLVTAGGPTVAVRVPAHPVALALLRAAGVPVAAPSANLSGQLSPTRAEHVLRSLNGRIDVIVDGGPAPGGLESTVLDLSRSPPRLLRPGLVTPSAIEAIIGPVERLAIAGQPDALLRSPGLLPRHYAPRAPLECAADNAGERVTELASQGQRVGWLTFAEPSPRLLPNVTAIAMPAQPTEYAARLYAVLHELDDAGVERIVVEMPPDREEWLTVRDRLRRASV